MKSVLVVDDEPLVRWALVQGLERRFRVLPASGPQEAHRVCDSHPVDAVLTDLVMPGVKGFGFIEEMLRRLPARPLFVLSACSDPELDGRLEALGVRACLSKPFLLSDVVGVLERHLGEAEEQEGIPREGSRGDRGDSRAGGCKA